MAVRDVTAASVGTQTVLYTWTGLLLSDTGTPVESVDLSDRTWQITGTFGTGGTCVIEGSMDNVNFFPLTDFQGNPLSKTAAAVETSAELTRYSRPRISAGDGTTNIAVTVLARRGSR